MIKNNFKLSQKSLDKLVGVDKRLAIIVKKAITVSRFDFGVSCGLRTLEEQTLLLKAGASKTLKSKHITGKAVDLFAVIDGYARWEEQLYDSVAYAMVCAAQALGTSLRWGGAWSMPDITKTEGLFGIINATESYAELCRSRGRRPFIDAPHFELID